MNIAAASEGRVWRCRALPEGDLRGRFLVAEAVVRHTRDALERVALIGIRDGGHEGIVFWAGLESAGLTSFTTVVVPDADHGAQRVHVNELQVGAAARAARAKGVCLLAQVHSHPGADARHSDGDDHLITMPFDGMLSIVVPHYGVDWQDLAEARVHQYQDGQWVLCRPASVKHQLVVPPEWINRR